MKDLCRKIAHNWSQGPKDLFPIGFLTEDLLFSRICLSKNTFFEIYKQRNTGLKLFVIGHNLDVIAENIETFSITSQAIINQTLLFLDFPPSSFILDYTYKVAQFFF